MRSGISAEVEEDATGVGGEVIVNTNSLLVTEGGTVSVQTAGESSGVTCKLIATEIVTVDGVSSQDGTSSSISAASLTDAPAGSVTIDTPNLTVNNGGTISVTGAGNGGAGNLSIDAQSISLENGASLQAEVAAGNRGNINLIANFLQLRNNSNITTNASGEATGGNITIDTTNLVAFGNSDITANAVEGIGGNIQITAEGIFLSPDSQITASSQFGVDGVVQINNPAVDPNSGLVNLSADTTDATQKVASGCSSLKGNSFTVTGRGGLPTDPYNSLSEPTVWLDERFLVRGNNHNLQAVTQCF